MSHNLSAITAALLLAGCSQNAQSPDEPPTPPASGQEDAEAKIGTLSPDSAGKTGGAEQSAKQQPAKGVPVQVATWKRGRSTNDAASGALASMSGKLLLQDACLVVQLDNGQLLQPVFPSDRASWNAEKQALIFNGKAYQEGASITVGGGGVASNSGFATQAGNNIPQCANAKLFVVSG